MMQCKNESGEKAFDYKIYIILRGRHTHRSNPCMPLSLPFSVEVANLSSAKPISCYYIRFQSELI